MTGEAAARADPDRYAGSPQEGAGVARRLPGGAESGYRKSDHSDEIAALRDRAGATTDRQEALVLAVAAELLQGHDDTGLSLDHWLAPRMLVEMLIGRSIIENEV